MLSDLPIELLQVVIDNCDSQCRDLNSLVQSNRQLYSRLNASLYSRGVQCSVPCFILLWAARNDVVNTATLAVQAGDKIDDGSQWETLLGHAARAGSMDMVEWLITKQGVDVNERDVDTGWAALLWAVTGNHIDVARRLLAEPGVDVNVTSFYDLVSPLSLASAQNYHSMACLLLDSPDIDVNVRDEREFTPLSLAAEACHVDVVRVLAARRDVDLNSTDNLGRTPLAWAAARCHVAIVQILLESGRAAESLARASCDVSPIWLAVRAANEVDRKDCIATVQLLLNGNDLGLSTPDVLGRTLLSFAIASRVDIEIVKLLVKSDKFDVNLNDNEGRNTFSWAASASLDTMQLLYNTGKVDIEAKELGTVITPLWRAILSRNLWGVKWLLRFETVDANARNIKGETPLQWEIQEPLWDYFDTLLRCPRVDVNARYGDGSTVLHIATHRGRGSFVKMIMATPGVDVNAQDSRGRTALCWACVKGYNFVVRELLKSSTIDVFRADDEGKDARSLAVQNSNKVCVELLWRSGHFDDRGGRRPIDHDAQRYIDTYLSK